MSNNKKKKKSPTGSTICLNRAARFHYEINERFEAGIVLEGTEVKSLRCNQANIQDAYAEIKNGEAWLINAHIPEYTQANRFNHFSRRRRKLLLKKKEITKLDGAVRRKGISLIPTAMYFNNKGYAKVELGLGTGKKLHDKRATQKDRDWNREKQRLLKRG